tara:strand:+ start:2226 stop:3338 length:1113 start_codon:yes stop_codon:yes gene_type:complete
MHIAILLWGFFVLGFCVFTSKDVKKQKLVEREMQSINFNDVDQFPLFENCDETNTKEENMQCFEETLLRHFSTLVRFEFVLTETTVDTTYVVFWAEKKGSVYKRLIISNSNSLKKKILPNGQQQIIDVPFSTVEEVPVFPGCEDAVDKRACFQEKMEEHISKNFSYPEEAQIQGIQGKVNVLFVITEDGNILNLKMRGPNTILENEASRIIALLPKMKPGKEKGKLVRVSFSIPITFKLQGTEKQDKEVNSIEDQDVAIPFTLVNKAPVFPGCEDAKDKKDCFRESLNEHISKNFKYPEEAQKKRVQGMVNILFVIGKDGVISNIRKHGPSKLLEDEAERIISLLPKMTPGVYKGKPVNIPFSVPIKFDL